MRRDWSLSLAVLALVGYGYAQDLTKPPNATKLVDVPFGKAKLWVDGSAWSEIGRDRHELRLIHRSGVAASIVSQNQGGVPASSLRAVALRGIARADPNARVVREQSIKVNGREVLQIEFAWRQGGTAVHALSLIHGGVDDGLRITALAPEAAFAASRAIMDEFLSGVEIEDTALPDTHGAARSSASPLRFGNFRLEFDETKWVSANAQPGRWLLTSRDGKATAGVVFGTAQARIEPLMDAELRGMTGRDPSTQVLREEDHTVNGLTVRLRELDSAPERVPLRYITYYYAGTQGSSEVVVWTARDNFEAKRGDLEAILEAFSVDAAPSVYPQDQP